MTHPAAYIDGRKGDHGVHQQTEHSASPQEVAPRPSGVQLRARRSPALVALGALLVVGGGVGAAALVSLNADQRAVVVMASDVRRGDALTREDLAVVEVPGTMTVEALGAADLPTLVGQRTLTDLPAGSFPLARHVGEQPLPDGESLVGLRLPLGKLPTADMPPGTPVRLVGLAEGGSADTSAVVAARPTLLDDGMTYAVDVRVADAEAATVARLSAADLLALVVVTEGR